VTYIIDLLITAWREEQSTKPLQPLPEKFTESIKDISTSLDKAITAMKEGSLQMAIARKEVEMLKYLWTDLLKIRKGKIEHAIQAGVPVNEQLLLDFEAEYYKALGSIAYKYDASKNIFPETRVPQEISSNYMAIRLINDAADFVAIDLRTYGPFKKEDIAYLPKEHAEIMIKEGKAKRIMAMGD